MINKTLLKIICVCSLFIGGLLGFLPLIPALIWIAFLLEMFFIAPFIIIYLKNLNLIKELKMENAMFIGALSGGVSFLGFSIIFFPISFILYLIFKIQSFVWIKVIFANFGFLIPMIILIALLSALFNAFSGFVVVYLYEIFNKSKRG